MLHQNFREPHNFSHYYFTTSQFVIMVKAFGQGVPRWVILRWIATQQRAARRQAREDRRVVRRELRTAQWFRRVARHERWATIRHLAMVAGVNPVEPSDSSAGVSISDDSADTESDNG